MFKVGDIVEVVEEITNVDIFGDDDTAEKIVYPVGTFGIVTHAHESSFDIIFNANSLSWGFVSTFDSVRLYRGA